MADRALLPNQTLAPNYAWRTPRAFFDLVGSDFGEFELDAAADHNNALGYMYYTTGGRYSRYWGEPERLCDGDGLTGDWLGLTWCNPPYGRELPLWVAKAREEAKRGATAVLLIPPSRNTRWWQEHVEGKAAEVRYLIGRIQFEAPPDRPSKPGDSNRYDSALVIYRPRYEARGAGTHSWSWDWRKELAA